MGVSDVSPQFWEEVLWLSQEWQFSSSWPMILRFFDVVFLSMKPCHLWHEVQLDTSTCAYIFFVEARVISEAAQQWDTTD